jgi:hypothetical protein
MEIQKVFRDIEINGTFKGQKLVRKVIDDESTEKDTRKKYPHPRNRKIHRKKTFTKAHIIRP